MRPWTQLTVRHHLARRFEGDNGMSGTGERHRQPAGPRADLEDGVTVAQCQRLIERQIAVLPSRAIIKSSDRRVWIVHGCQGIAL
jgi:hypothetical protein